MIPELPESIPSEARHNITGVVLRAWKKPRRVLFGDLLVSDERLQGPFRARKRWRGSLDRATLRVPGGLLALMLTKLLIGPLLLLFYFAPKIIGRIFAWDAFAGTLLILSVAAAGGLGIRLYRDSRRRPAIRRLSLAVGAYCALLGLASVPFAFVETAAVRFSDWHASGAGLRPGQTLDDARRILARNSVVTELGANGFTGACFEVEPIGLARYSFGFPLGEIYYLDVAVDKTGRVVTVKPRSD